MNSDPGISLMEGISPSLPPTAGLPAGLPFGAYYVEGCLFSARDCSTISEACSQGRLPRGVIEYAGGSCHRYGDLDGRVGFSTDVLTVPRRHDWLRIDPHAQCLDWLGCGQRPLFRHVQIVAHHRWRDPLAGCYTTQLFRAKDQGSPNERAFLGCC